MKNRKRINSHDKSPQSAQRSLMRGQGSTLAQLPHFFGKKGEFWGIGGCKSLILLGNGFWGCL